MSMTLYSLGFSSPSVNNRDILKLLIWADWLNMLMVVKPNSLYWSTGLTMDPILPKDEVRIWDPGCKPTRWVVSQLNPNYIKIAYLTEKVWFYTFYAPSIYQWNIKLCKLLKNDFCRILLFRFTLLSLFHTNIW